MQWHTQDGNIANNLMIEVDFTLPEIRAMNAVTWKYHVYDSAKRRYDVILEIVVLTKLGQNLKFSYHVIKADDGPFKGSTTPMFDLGACEFKDINTGKIVPS